MKRKSRRPQDPELRRRYNQKEHARKKAKKLKNTVGFVYIMESTAGGYRIGHSTNPQERAERMRHMIPGHEARLLHVIPSNDFRTGEAELQSKFEDKRFIGHWFVLEPTDVSYLKSLRLHENGEWKTSLVRK